MDNCLCNSLTCNFILAVFSNMHNTILLYTLSAYKIIHEMYYYGNIHDNSLINVPALFKEIILIMYTFFLVCFCVECVYLQISPALVALVLHIYTHRLCTKYLFLIYSLHTFIVALISGIFILLHNIYIQQLKDIISKCSWY